MEVLRLVPRGNVEVDKNYGNNTVEFESGARQFQRKWITPRVTYTFSTEHGDAERLYLQGFINRRHGNLRPFLWNYDWKDRIVRFAESTIKFTEVRGYEGLGIIGYKAQIALVECKAGEYDAEDDYEYSLTPEDTNDGLRWVFYSTTEGPRYFVMDDDGYVIGENNKLFMKSGNNVRYSLDETDGHLVYEGVW